MHFSSGIVRPPYEAYSTFLQVTSGCSHNKCRFCTFYKDAPFRVSPESEIREDLAELRTYAGPVERLYLQGADPFLLSYEKLQHIADLIHEYLPSVQSIGGYGRVDSVKNKSVEQLKKLKETGYDMIVFGIESGDDVVLDRMNKGYHAQDIVDQLSKMTEAGLVLRHLPRRSRRSWLWAGSREKDCGGTQPAYPDKGTCLRAHSFS